VKDLSRPEGRDAPVEPGEVVTSSTSTPAASHLRVVAAPLPPTLGPVALEATLSSAPFRPGELPVITWIAFDRASQERVEEGATAARVPAELWLRLAVESSRLAEEIATRCGRARLWIVDVLDSAAASAEHTIDDELRTDGLVRYAALLRRPHPIGQIPGRMPARLPEEMAGGWRRAATHAGVTFERWLGERLERAPSRCVEWEIAAADSCQTLAEWTYAASLRALATTMA
jgi:hypothetical protein